MEKIVYPMISIIVPVYNIEKYIDQCVKSIVNQTYTNIEIILVDDGSKDSCGMICDEWSKKDSRIRVIHKENGGLVSARKAGVLEANGEYIGYVDGDDWIEPDMYMQMYEKGARQNVDLVAVEGFREYADGTSDSDLIMLREGIYEEKEDMKLLVSDLIATDCFFQYNAQMSLCRHLFRRQLLVQNQLKVDDQVTMMEDVACVFPCYMNAHSASLIHEKLYHYRQNEKSMRYTSKREDAKGICYLEKRLKEELSVYKNNKESTEKEILYLIYYVLLWSAYERCVIEEDSTLFPFDIPMGSRIALYGAGPFGMQIYNYVKETAVVDVLLWTDKRWQIYKERGMDVQDFEQLKYIDYDYIVVAVLNAQSQKAITERLISLGIESAKIQCCRPEMLSEERLQATLNRIKEQMVLE